jgi:hypothetical protein
LSLRKALVAIAGLGCLAAGAAAAPAAVRLDKWAGHYSQSFMSGLVDGSKFRATNEVEIRPVDAVSADVELNLSFFNGHMCWIEGRAMVEGSKLVLNQPELESREGQPCRLEIWRDRTHLRWSDGDNTCKDACGARGTFSQGSVPLRSKRRLRVLTPAGKS